MNAISVKNEKSIQELREEIYFFPIGKEAATGKNASELIRNVKQFLKILRLGLP